MRSLRLRAPAVFKRPAGRASTAMLTSATLLGAFAVAAGVGYTASRPLLGDGCAFLGKGHTVAHVCGETGKSDAEIAQQLATGKEELQTVRLPDGRLAIVNQSTGTVSYFDSATLAPTSPPVAQPESAGELEPIPTATDGYLVDSSRKVVEKIGNPQEPAPAPARVEIPDGIAAAVPGGDSLWVMTPKGDVVEVVDGKEKRTIRSGGTAAGITVADGLPVVVRDDGNAYAIEDGKQRLLGNVGLSGRTLRVASWRGAGRYVVAVDPGSGRVGVLDPRTGHHGVIQLKITPGRNELEAPVMLGEWVYVPDRSAPGLWRINVPKGTADEKPLEVPGDPGRINVTVESGHVWAHSQYDRRVLVVDTNGNHRTADKGPRPELGDDTGQSGPPGAGAGTGQPGQTGGPAGPPGTETRPMVAVPTFGHRTPYRQACEEIKKLKLICRAVAGGDQEGLRTGDVLGTDPKAGTQVPEGSRVIVRYAGPLAIPSVVGVWHEDACKQIEAAKLKCAPTIDPTPASGPQELGVVTTQSPGPEEKIAKGRPIAYTYRDSIELPSMLDQAHAAACDRIRTYRMTCTATEGTVPPAGKVPGQVYVQNPAAPYVAKIGSAVTLTYYKGRNKVPPVTGLDIDTACTQIQRAGFACNPQEGTTAWGSGQAARTVYQQSHPADDTTHPVGTPITLIYRSPNNDLPNYGGVDAGAACADINARGFHCQPVTTPSTAVNVVVAQDRPAGPQPLGSPVVIHYNPHRLIDLWISPYGAGWRMHEGPGPAPTYRIGYVYDFNARFSTGGERPVYQYSCAAGGSACRGYGQSVFYSRIVPGSAEWQTWVDPQFQHNWAPLAGFMTCTGAPGQRRVWRIWDIDQNRRFRYGLVHDNPAGHSDSEELGCVWW